MIKIPNKMKYPNRLKNTSSAHPLYSRLLSLQNYIVLPLNLNHKYYF